MAFSTRLNWDQKENALTRLLSRKLHAGAAVLDLTESNPTCAGFQYDADAVLGAMRDRRALLYQPSAKGLEEARAAISSYYADHGVRVDTSRILLTSGTSEAYSYLFKLLADPGDEILVPRPSYPLFEHLAGLESVRLRQYPLFYQEGWWLDGEALRRVIGPRTRAIVALNPNNPTGSFLKQPEVDTLANLCREHDLAVICDEVFSDFVLDDRRGRLRTLAARDDFPSVSLNGVSKMLGLPQMKLGWMVVNGPEVWRDAARRRLEWVADSFLSVGAPVQHAAARWMSLRPAFQMQVMERLRTNLAALRQAIAEQPLCGLLHVEGGWYATIRLPRVRGEEEWVIGLLDAGDVYVQPGYFFDFESEAHVVVSLLTPPARFVEGVRRMMKHVESCCDRMGGKFLQE